MRANAVPGFQPSTSGFHFANRFPSVPAFSVGLGFVHLGLGNAAYGLCGGMCFATRDRFERREAIPVDATPPAAGTPLFRELARRQLDSFDHLVGVPLAFWRLAIRSPGSRARATVNDELPRVLGEIDRGRLAMVGLLRHACPNPLHLGLNHQVAAYAYEAGDDIVDLAIYDPNHPDRDDVRVTLAGRGRAGGGAGTSFSMTQSSGEPSLGLLSLPYRGR